MAHLKKIVCPLGLKMPPPPWRSKKREVPCLSQGRVSNLSGFELPSLTGSFTYNVITKEWGFLDDDANVSFALSTAEFDHGREEEV